MMTDSFSFSRLEMLRGFYDRRIMRQWGISLIALVLIYCLGLLGTALHSFGTVSTSLTMLPYIVYFGPLVFATRDRTLQLQLPVTISERMALMLIYCGVIMPVAVAALWYSLEGLGEWLTGGLNVMGFYDSELLRIQQESAYSVNVTLRTTLVTRLLGELVPTLTCLYAVLSSRSHRMLKGILSVFGMLLAMGLIGGIYGGIMAFIHPPVSGESSETFISTLMSSLPTFTLIVTAIFSTILFILIWRTLRRPEA